MKKLFSAILLTLFISLLNAETANNKIRVGVLNGPSAVPSAYLMKNLKNVEFTKYADPQALLPKLIKKEADIGFLPVNVAAKVYNSTHGAIICAAVTGNGNLSLITSQDIKRFSDLKKKTIYVAGQGATPEYMLKYLLQQNGLNLKKDVEFNYSIPTAQIAPNVIGGKIKYAVVPEPFATIAASKSEKVKVALDLQREYMELNETGENYPLTVMVVRKAFAEESPDLLDGFLEEYKKASSWTVNNPKACGQLVEEYDLGLEAGIVTKAIPNSNYVFIPANEAKKRIENLLNIFIEFEPEAVGEKLPGQDFYYESGKETPQL